MPQIKVSNDVIITKIYGLESTWGKNDKCIRKGKGINGLGFGQRINVDNCYPTFEAVKSDVNDWLNKRFAEGYSLPEALCYYNTGYKQETCEYYQNYLKL